MDTSRRKNSLQTTSPATSPRASPLPMHRTIPRASSQNRRPEVGDVPSPTPPASPSVTAATPWRSRLHTIKNSFLGSPRFHRRKMQVPSSEEVGCTPDSSPELTKKSWFGALMGTEKEDHHFVMIRDKNLSQIKADLVHSFLCVSDLS
eukprot:GHVO01048268.1.p1 GENE.GHVO01048268.1~~GHVO01048268.1.p1  ORF type:complete len:148 (-),score=11.10 GHVO01048268.1:249-692(-)